jgi:hypothetical protein
MNAKFRFAAALVAAATLVAALSSLAVADPKTDKPADKPAAKKPAAKEAAAAPESQLPPGWTEADMKAFIAASTPGKEHEHLAKDVGVWLGKNTMWMTPGAPPVETDSKTTITPLFDGRFIKCELEGEMPGMGPYRGLAISGYDNVTQKFVSTWVDNFSTAMAKGEGELSKDGKTLTWAYECSCPLTDKPMSMRQIETSTGPNSKVIEMFGTEPKSGEEYKMMRIELTRSDKSAAPAAAKPASRTGR